MIRRLLVIACLGWWAASSIAYAAYPVVAATSTSVTDTASTSHVVSLPTGIASGHLVICGITVDTNPAPLTWPGWTVLSSTLNGTNIRFETAYRNADGTEGSTITVTSDLTVRSSHQCRRITGHDPAIAPQAGTAAALTDNSPNPPAVTPTGGAKDYLWIAFQGNDGTISVTGYPANYTDSQLLADGIATATGSATRNLNAASEDPGVFTLPAAEQWVAQTVVVHPAQTNPTLNPFWKRYIEEE